jgi:hypothetical protein
MEMILYKNSGKLIFLSKLFTILFICNFSFSQVHTGEAKMGKYSKEDTPTIDNVEQDEVPYNFTTFKSREVKNLEEWKKYNKSEYYSHPEFGILPEDAPCQNCVEDLEKRKEDERYFMDISDKGKFYQQKSYGAINQQINGQWLAIDQHLHPASSMRYESAYFLAQTIIDFGLKRTELNTSEGSLHFNNWTLVIVRENGQTEELQPNWADYTVGADGTIIKNIFPGMDAEMIVSRGQIKTSFIIKTNELGVFKQLLFRETPEGLNDLNIKFENGNYTQGVGNLLLLNGTTEVAQMQEAFLYGKNAPKDINSYAAYNIHSNKIDIIVDYEWIAENIGQYQLVVDPTLTSSATLAQASITGSGYSASCAWTAPCNYNLTVAIPAQTTVIDIVCDFSYKASGSCLNLDGAIRYTMLGCISPSDSYLGYAWSCQGVGTLCDGTGISIFPDVSNCLPPPSCNSQNVTFGLQFSRCWGSGAGCSNTCIGANSPWKVTITGKTVEFSNPTTQITAPASACPGETFNVSTAGMYGVPPYTYSWSNGATTASTTYTMPTSGNQTVSVIITDACGNTASANKIINAGPGPTVTVSPSTTVCQGTPVTLTSNATPPNNNLWSTGASGKTITVTPSATTTYSVKNGTGCSTFITITVVPNTTPTFTQLGPYCVGETPDTLPTTSNNGITGTWSPATINTGIQGTPEYTFTPSSTCAPTTKMYVTINPKDTPAFTQVGPLCQGDPSVTLPTSSTNPTAITGTWSPATVTTTTAGTTTYTFTPSSGS